VSLKLTLCVAHVLQAQHVAKANAIAVNEDGSKRLLLTPVSRAQQSGHLQHHLGRLRQLRKARMVFAIINLGRARKIYRGTKVG